MIVSHLAARWVLVSSHLDSEFVSGKGQRAQQGRVTALTEQCFDVASALHKAVQATRGGVVFVGAAAVTGGGAAPIGSSR